MLSLVTSVLSRAADPPVGLGRQHLIPDLRARLVRELRLDLVGRDVPRTLLFVLQVELERLLLVLEDGLLRCWPVLSCSRATEVSTLL